MIVLKEAECCAPDAARTVVQHPCAGDRVRPQLKRDPLGGGNRAIVIVGDAAEITEQVKPYSENIEVYDTEGNKKQ